MIPNKAQLLVINKELKNNFNSITEAKKQAKNQYNKVKKEFENWNKLSKRKKLQIIPPSIIESFISINKVDYLYYSDSKGILTAPNGSGYYVRLKTKCGVIDYKI